ncbi:MAG: DNA repair and recombination protein RadA, partial [archaeon]|nr:DNA repair and recombination protein RadA [archaeon]
MFSQNEISKNCSTGGVNMGKVIKNITDLPGVGPQAAEKLVAAGYKTLE